MKQKLIVVGNGMVTGRFLDALLAQPACPYEITVLCAEAHGNYNRIQLSSVLSGEASFTSIVQKAPDWFVQNGLALHQDDAVEYIDRQNRFVCTKSGRTFHYDHLVLATGSRAARIPAQTHCSLGNVLAFRSLDDTQQLIALSQSAQTACVVGGGFLGLEAAWGLMQRGLKVKLIHRSKHLLNRQLDPSASAMLRDKLERLGLEVILNDEIAAFNGENLLSSVSLKSGRRVDCDLAVVATGITPNAELGWSAGLEGTRAIKVDQYMRTSDPCISAIGECVEFEGTTFGLVDPLWRHAQTLALRLCGEKLRRSATFLNYSRSRSAICRNRCSNPDYHQNVATL